MQKGKINAYQTIIMGRPILYKVSNTSTTVHTSHAEHKQQTNSLPKVCTNNVGFNLWQWLRK